MRKRGEEVKNKPRNDTSYKGKGVEKKKKDVIKKRASRVPKTRNAGTQTEASFWSFIGSALRKASRFWKPIQKAKMEARRPYEGPNKRQKFEYLCNHCNQYFKETDIEVDHIVPAGSLRKYEDLPGFVERLFSEDGYQVLCDRCHAKKSTLDRLAIKLEKLHKNESTNMEYYD